MTFNASGYSGKTGWQPKQTIKETKHYSLKTVVSEYDTKMVSLEPQIKNKFCTMFAEKFIKDDIISISSHKNPSAPYETIYQAEMTVAPVDATSVMQSTNTFFAYNQHWTEEEIYKALKHTFPERLI